jgi:hypothetical protein
MIRRRMVPMTAMKIPPGSRDSDLPETDEAAQNGPSFHYSNTAIKS